MSFLLRRRPRIAQPQDAARIDWSNPINRDLEFAFDAAQGLRNLVDERDGEPLGSGVLRGAGEPGEILEFAGSQGNRSASLGATNALYGATSATWDILIRFDAANPSTHFWGRWDFATAWLLQATNGWLIWVAAADGGGNRRRFDSQASIFPASGWHRLTASWRGGNDRTLMVNGIEHSTTIVNEVATSIAGDPANDYHQFGTVNGGGPLDGGIAFARLWRRGLSVDEMLDLYQRPYAPYAEQRIWVPVSAGGGGSIDLTAAGASTATSLSAAAAAQVHALLANALASASSATTGSATQVHQASAAGASSATSATTGSIGVSGAIEADPPSSATTLGTGAASQTHLGLDAADVSSAASLSAAAAAQAHAAIASSASSATSLATGAASQAHAVSPAGVGSATSMTAGAITQVHAGLDAGDMAQAGYLSEPNAFPAETTGVASKRMLQPGMLIQR